MADNNVYLPTDGATAPTGYEKTKQSAKTLADSSRVQRMVPVVSTGSDSVAEVSAAAPLPTGAADGKIETIGLKADAPATDPTAALTLVGLFKGLWQALGLKADVAVTDPTAAGSLLAVSKGQLAALGAKADTIPADATAIAGSNSIVALLKSAARSLLAPVLGAGEAHVGQVGGDSTVVAASFTRPATVGNLVSGQIIANSATAGSVAATELPLVARKDGGSGRATRGRFTRSKNEAGDFRIHLFRTAPTFVNGDGGAFKIASPTGYIGSIDVSVSGTIFQTGARGFSNLSAFITFLAATGSKSLYYAVEARGAITSDASEQFTFDIEADRD